MMIAQQVPACSRGLEYEDGFGSERFLHMGAPKHIHWSGCIRQDLVSNSAAIDRFEIESNLFGKFGEDGVCRDANATDFSVSDDNAAKP